MGTGKTTIARGLARHFSADVLDTDKLVEQRAGRSVRDIFARDGEESFRDLESEVLGECLRTPGRAIVAGAGGVVLRENNREAINAARASGAVSVVWLHARPEVLVGRTKKGSHRPLLDNDQEGTLRRMADERAPMYSSVADVVVDVSERSPDSVIALVIDALTVAETESAG